MGDIDLWHAVTGFKLPCQCVEHPLFTAYACYGYMGMFLMSLTATQPSCGFCSLMLGEVYKRILSDPCPPKCVQGSLEWDIGPRSGHSFIYARIFCVEVSHR